MPCDDSKVYEGSINAFELFKSGESIDLTDERISTHILHSVFPHLVTTNAAIPLSRKDLHTRLH